MPIKLELLGETVEGLAAELEALSAIIRPIVQATAEPVTVSTAVLKDFSLEDLRALIVERFDAEGYEVTIALREPKTKKKGGRPPLTTVDEALKNLKPNGGGEPASEPELETKPEPQEDPEADKKFVIEELGVLVKNPRSNQGSSSSQGKSPNKMASQKSPRCQRPLFPDIRRAMEQEFGTRL